ncbi:hypothetical protein [Mesorhizobium silamurunense]|uniref:hypothetical protein n=1 Tax=Mesorhizobium silamurunense TaxID=499528 RepID=UPI00177FDD3B|nr:hypothetical protein [Mesorhizobium silamurunense]
MSADEMTAGDRRMLIGIVKQRERVAKAAAAERSAHLLADFERQLDQEFSFNDNTVWKEATAIAEAAVAEAAAKIKAECQRLGIPPEFAPYMNLSWYSRGENASKERRAELRNVAARTIAAAEKTAKLAIEKQSVETQEKIMSSGISSAAARLFLESMPTVESLMPQITVPAMKAIAGPART